MPSKAKSRVSTVIRLAKIMEVMLAELGLTSNQFRMLTFVDAGAPPMRELSLRLVMKPPNITAMIDGLVARGLVRRERCELDGRRRRLTLTPAGSALLATAEERCAEALKTVAAAGAERPRDALAGLDPWVSSLDAVAGQLARGELLPGN